MFDFFSIKLCLTDDYLVISCDPQVPFKHDSLLVDKKELKLTKAEKREAKRGKRPILISFCVLSFNREAPRIREERASGAL